MSSVYVSRHPEVELYSTNSSGQSSISMSIRVPDLLGVCTMCPTAIAWSTKVAAISANTVGGMDTESYALLVAFSPRALLCDLSVVAIDWTGTILFDRALKIASSRSMATASSFGSRNLPSICESIADLIASIVHDVVGSLFIGGCTCLYAGKSFALRVFGEDFLSFSAVFSVTFLPRTAFLSAVVDMFRSLAVFRRPFSATTLPNCSAVSVGIVCVMQCVLPHGLA